MTKAKTKPEPRRQSLRRLPNGRFAERLTLQRTHERVNAIDNRLIAHHNTHSIFDEILTSHKNILTNVEKAENLLRNDIIVVRDKIVNLDNRTTNLEAQEISDINARVRDRLTQDKARNICLITTLGVGISLGWQTSATSGNGFFGFITGMVVWVISLMLIDAVLEGWNW